MTLIGENRRPRHPRILFERQRGDSEQLRAFVERHDRYFLALAANDGSNVIRVFRLERDGESDTPKPERTLLFDCLACGALHRIKIFKDGTVTVEDAPEPEPGPKPDDFDIPF
jgi:hypothetical protein